MGKNKHSSSEEGSSSKRARFSLSHKHSLTEADLFGDASLDLTSTALPTKTKESVSEIPSTSQSLPHERSPRIPYAAPKVSTFIESPKTKEVEKSKRSKNESNIEANKAKKSAQEKKKTSSKKQPVKTKSNPRSPKKITRPSKFSKKTTDAVPLDSSSTSDIDTDTSLSDSEQTSLKSQVKTLTQTVSHLSQMVMQMSQNQSSHNFLPPHPSSSLPSTSGQTGESLLNMFTRPINNKVEYTSGLQAGENLPEKLKNKIWENKYVDFFALIHPDIDDSFSFSLTNITNPSLDLVPRKKRPLTEQEWGKAFDDFMAIYTKKFPAEIQDLITYGKFIKELMAAGHNWSYYDSKFRKDREFSLCKWTTIRIDLQITASLIKRHFPATPTPLSQRPPRGYCFKYHSRNERCQTVNCTWKHTCPRCGRNHPIFLPCFSDQNSPNKWNHNVSTRPNGEQQAFREVRPSITNQTKKFATFTK